MSAILFDRHRVDHLDEMPRRPPRLRGSKLLWVDIDRRTDETVEEVAQAFDLDPGTRDRLALSCGRAVYQDHGRYIHLTTYSPLGDEDDEELCALECVVGENWVITAHDRPVPVLEEFAERVSGSGNTGVLEGLTSSRPCSNGS
jgi:Mg2+ and Co2+ transporter CorA